MKGIRHGPTEVRIRRTAKGWYIIVGTIAICSFNAPPHLHQHADREHPDHHPKVPLDAHLTYAEAMRRVGVLCERLDRAPSLEALRRALA